MQRVSVQQKNKLDKFGAFWPASLLSIFPFVAVAPSPPFLNVAGAFGLWPYVHSSLLPESQASSVYGFCPLYSKSWTSRAWGVKVCLACLEKGQVWGEWRVPEEKWRMKP